MSEAFVEASLFDAERRARLIIRHRIKPIRSKLSIYVRDDVHSEFTVQSTMNHAVSAYGDFACRTTRGRVPLLFRVVATPSLAATR